MMLPDMTAGSGAQAVNSSGLAGEREAKRAAAGEGGVESRPRGLLVGELDRLGGGAALRRRLSLQVATPEEVAVRLGDEAPDLVLLDGSLPRPALDRVLQALGPPGTARRPAVFLVAPPGTRLPVDADLAAAADEFVSGIIDENELLMHIHGVLRARGYLAELSRKNAELEELYARVESMARRMGDELRLASNVQRSLLPPPLQHPDLEVAGEFIPVREIGGDYYDLVPLGPRRLAFAIGDVMGKGVPAALLAANLKACLRAQLQTPGVAPDTLVERVNRLFWEVTPKGLFASLFFGVFDPERGILEYVNAGHDYPFLVRADGQVLDLARGGTVLGLLEHSLYERESVPVGAGDVLVLYSDGVTDRGNQDGESFGVERLKEAALRSRYDGARLVLYSLLGEIQGWSSGTPAEDDMTLVVAKLRASLGGRFGAPLSAIVI